MASFSRSTVPFDLATSGKGPARGKSRSNTFNSSNSIPGKSTSTDKSTSIVAIAEGSGASKGTVGLAIMDLRQADIELSEFMDSPTFSRLKIKLLVADPVEIIVAENFYEKTRNAVMTEMIRSSIPNVVITNVHKRFFNRARGAELVTQLANAEISNCDRAVLKK
ncbi:unnamed protein product [Heligmosomoides polygyrus]|uniref:MutS_II domain-containing protein n=1 Tax=Heligmosomoides polygyrus TaxID=6339 RepID=A0A183G3F0_HELPZ|nr:unnamed protein product [Heligmosomoides polygyrus]